MENNKNNLNPYIGGILIGLTLLFVEFLLGRGLSASKFFAEVIALLGSIIAPSYIKSHIYFHKYAKFFDYTMFLIIGASIGGLVSAYQRKRLGFSLDKGPNISEKGRLTFAFIGGIITGIGVRLARGCTSGQALTGGATLAVGSWLFMFSVFIGGYLFAYIVRREWL